MPSLVIDGLGTNKRVARGVIGVDSWDYYKKTGGILVTVSSFNPTFTGTGSCKAYLRPANYNPATDKHLIGPVTLGPSHANPSVDANCKFLFAVNYGAAPPSAMIEGDGTYSLLELVVEFNDDATTLAGSIEVGYDILFTEMDEANGHTWGSEQIHLFLDQWKQKDSKNLLFNYDGITGTGLYMVSCNSLSFQTILHNKVHNDSVPFFSVSTTPQDQTYTDQLIGHPLAKMSRYKQYMNPNYPGRKPNFVWAVNDFKIDANGKKAETHETSFSLLRIQLEKVRDWPCDDDIDLAFLPYMKYLSFDSQEGGPGPGDIIEPIDGGPGEIL